MNSKLTPVSQLREKRTKGNLSYPFSFSFTSPPYPFSKVTSQPRTANTSFTFLLFIRLQVFQLRRLHRLFFFTGGVLSWVFYPFCVCVIEFSWPWFVPRPSGSVLMSEGLFTFVFLCDCSVGFSHVLFQCFFFFSGTVKTRLVRRKRHGFR